MLLFEKFGIADVFDSPLARAEIAQKGTLIEI